MDAIQADFDIHTVYAESATDTINNQNNEAVSSHENSPPQPKELTKEEKEAVSWWKNPLHGCSQYLTRLFYGESEEKRVENELFKKHKAFAEQGLASSQYELGL